MKNIFTRHYHFIFIIIIVLIGIPGNPINAEEHSPTRSERVADRHFLNQKFDKAIPLYEKAIEKTTSDEIKAELHAKAGRLCYMLRRYPQATGHYGNAMDLQEESLTISDVCDYVDALRFQKLDKQAEKVCLRYAYQNVNRRNQRFMNTLDALSMRHTWPSDTEYTVTPRQNDNTAGAEYWMGTLNGQLCFARSDNRYNDPGARFYGDTKIYPFSTNDRKPTAYREKGLTGPFAVFGNNCKIGTAVESLNNRKAKTPQWRQTPYTMKLTIIGGKRKELDKTFLQLFPQEKESSYCHPFLFDESRVLLFASDVPGGYGGYDLYMTHWDDDMGVWEDPVNLGPEINTAGDEIYPTYNEGKLYFASNGHPGYGGYDLYSYEHDPENEAWIPGSLTHLPAPVNSPYNDFCLLPADETRGYFISDRSPETGDDIYEYRHAEKKRLSTPFFGMAEQDAVMGGQTMLTGLLEQTRQHKTRKIRFPAESPKGLMLTLYFNFNRTELTPEASEQLKRFINTDREYEIRNIRVLGYADEIGSDKRNQILSRERAKTVAGKLKQKFGIPIEITGCGSTLIPAAMPDSTAIEIDIRSVRNRELPVLPPVISFTDRINMNQHARRVEIYINE